MLGGAGRTAVVVPGKRTVVVPGKKEFRYQIVPAPGKGAFELKIDPNVGGQKFEFKIDPKLLKWTARASSSSSLAPRRSGVCAGVRIDPET